MMLADFVSQDSAYARRWFVFNRAGRNAGLRLFCFHYAGGAASFCRNWAQELPGVEVVGVQLPGREQRFHETPFRSSVPLIAALASVMPCYLDKPYGVFGHSMGGFLAFEMIRALRQRALPAPVLFIPSACRAPHIPGADPPTYTLEGDAFIAALARKGFMKNMDTLAENTELKNLFLPLLKADTELVETYSCERTSGSVTCPIIAFGGSSDPTVTDEMLVSWKQHTTSSFAVRRFVGDHFFVETERSDVLAEIRVALIATAVSRTLMADRSVTAERA